MANLKRKAEAAESMFRRLVELMNESLRVERSKYGDVREQLPAWIA